MLAPALQGTQEVPRALQKGVQEVLLAPLVRKTLFGTMLALSWPSTSQDWISKLMKTLHVACELCAFALSCQSRLLGSP